MQEAGGNKVPGLLPGVAASAAGRFFGLPGGHQWIIVYSKVNI